MRRSSSLLALCLLALAGTAALTATATATAATRGITEKGDEVLLEDNGTWHYLKAPPAGAETATVPVNPTRFTRRRDAVFPVRSGRNNAVVYLNPKKWSFVKSTKSGDGEYMFKGTDNDLYGTMITERFSVPMEKIGGIALNNLRQAAPDAELVRQEYRWVNDRQVLFMQLNATIQGIRFTYAGYYYADDGGTTQLLVWTSRNLSVARMPAMEEFLDGFLPTAVPATPDTPASAP